MVTVQPLYVGAEGNISIWHDEEGMMLRFGKEGCRIDVEVGRDINQTSKPARVASNAQDISVSLGMDPPSYTQMLYKQPSSACAETKVMIRTYWGFVEFQDDYRARPGVVIALNQSRRYGDEGCKVDVRVSKVD